MSASNSCDHKQQSLVPDDVDYVPDMVRRKLWTTTNTTSTKSLSRPMKNKTNDLTDAT